MKLTEKTIYKPKVGILTQFELELKDYCLNYSDDCKENYRNDLIDCLSFPELNRFISTTERYNSLPEQDELINWIKHALIKTGKGLLIKNEIIEDFKAEFSRALRCDDNFHLLLFCINRLTHFELLSKESCFSSFYSTIITKLRQEIIRLKTELYSEVKCSAILSLSQALATFFFKPINEAKRILKQVAREIKLNENESFKDYYFMPAIDRLESRIGLDYIPFISFGNPKQNILKLTPIISLDELRKEEFPLGFVFENQILVKKENIIYKKSIQYPRVFIKANLLFYNYHKSKNIEISKEDINHFLISISNFYYEKVDYNGLCHSRRKIHDFFKSSGLVNEFLFFTGYLREKEILDFEIPGSVKKFLGAYEDYFFGLDGFKIESVKNGISRKETREKYEHLLKSSFYDKLHEVIEALY